MTTRTHTRDARAATALATVEGAYAALRAGTAGAAPAWLHTAQDKAFETFRSAGFPRAKDEDWKYTNLAGFAERSADYLQHGPSGDGNIAALLDDLPSIEGAIRIVFVNGLYRPDPAGAANPTAGVELTPYSTADATTGKYIFRDQPIDDKPMIALNTAFLTDGLAIRVADDAIVNTPIHVVFASDGQPAAAQPRLSIDIGTNADALVVQHHVGAGDSLTNAVTSIDCAEHSRLFFIRLQNESTESLHVSNQVVRVAADARFDNVSIDFGGRLARSDLEVELHGERAHAALHGLFMTNGKRHVDNHLRVDHRAPHTTSLESYRGILSDSARGVFNGKIIVHSGADGTDAQMSNRNLLLGERAEIDTKPELEIYTDEVKCAHGSTTGQLDSDAMFYLRARGIPEATVRLMLVGAFAREIIEQTRSKSPALADYLGEQMNEQLPDNV